MANVYSKCNALWTQVFKAYDKFLNKIKLTNDGEALSEPICFNQRIRDGNINIGLIKVSIVLHFLNDKKRKNTIIDFSEKI